MTPKRTAGQPLNLADPYGPHPESDWDLITEQLIQAHPLGTTELVEAVLGTWKGLKQTRIGARRFQLGKDIWPSPQIMGSFLHEIIPLEFKARYPGVWRRGQKKGEKDLVHE